MRLESVWLRHIQAGTVLVDGRIEAMNSLHEDFDIGCGATGTQGDRCASGVVAGAIVACRKTLQHSKIEWRRFARRDYPIYVDYNQTNHHWKPSSFLLCGHHNGNRMRSPSCCALR